MAEEELEPMSTHCPRCKGVAQIRSSRTGTAEVSCPNCGSFEAPWEEFDDGDSGTIGSNGQS
jgi:uncharacterized Zn finger protein (UPF0148 family)